MAQLTSDKVTRTITMPLELKDDSYGRRWVSPECIQVRGNFRHNRNSPFHVVVFETADAFCKWHGLAPYGDHGRKPDDAIGDLVAQASVLLAQPGPRDFYLNVTVNVGDRLRTYLGLLEVRDDWALHDPYLVWVGTR